MTPPDYKEKAAELAADAPWGADPRVAKKWEPIIAAALTQADALGYARGLMEAARMTRGFDHDGEVTPVSFADGLAKELEARALTAEPANDGRCDLCQQSGCDNDCAAPAKEAK